MIYGVSGCVLALLIFACSPRIPEFVDKETEQKLAKKRGLVDVRQVIPDIVVQLPYATANNVAGDRLYPPDMTCYLHQSTAQKLARAQGYLRQRGYRLKIWDGYRPPEAQQKLFDLAGSTGYVADPKFGWGRHCSGTAVDVTMLDSQGRECRMPTRFDDFTKAASSNYQGTDPVIRENLAILQNAMFKAGFTVLKMEWWHFNDRDFDGFPLPPPVFGSQIGFKLP